MTKAGDETDISRVPATTRDSRVATRRSQSRKRLIAALERLAAAKIAHHAEPSSGEEKDGAEAPRHPRRLKRRCPARTNRTTEEKSRCPTPLTN